MDKIRQYNKITDVKPEYYNLYIPMNKASKKKIIFNGKELELHYVKEFGTYVDDPHEFKVGGSEKNKITCLSL